MSGGINRLKVDVDDLRKGMYVTEPDRPWVEVPLPLQGFVLETDEELEILRQYCKFVYVDPVKSDDSEGERDLHSSGGGAGADGEERRGGQSDGIDESKRHVDPDQLRPQLEAASQTFSTARRFLDEAFTDAFRGRGVNASAAESTISDLVTRLTENPTASLLLTSMNDRDSFTSMHSVHVAVLTIAFFLRAQLDPRKLEVLALGALLHDIGKTRLPRELIERPGPLDKIEWDLVKQHPIESQRILAAGGRVPRAALNIASMHHELRDGSGYPHGLAKDDLPQYVLVTSLINRYQSLTSDRPYRGAAAPDQVLRSFYKNAGTQYGMRPVEAFIRCVGIYPVGSLVELDNGALAVVVSSRPNTRLKPVIQLVRTPDGEPYEKIVLLNLAAEPRQGDHKREGALVRSVRRVRSPTDTGIDPGRVIAQSFGIQIG